MTPAILRDPDTVKRLLETILDSPNGKRSLSRLARTCKAMCEPALNMLWKELDSLVPLIGLFPSHLLKRWKKPGMGFVKAPLDGDWKKVLSYGERVRRLTYDESPNNVSSTIFPIIEEYRPRTYILPHLTQLTWKVETPAGLDRCSLFLNPELQGLILEIETRFPQINAFLADMSSRTRLTTFSFVSPTTLPDAFTELLLPQERLEKVVLVAPGALSPEVGRWIASLHTLKTLQLDLSGRSMIAVEGFFDDIRIRSGDSTPTSVGSTDSGVFSGEELDFSDIRKSALRLTGDLTNSGSFAQMRSLYLTGEVSNIAVFLKHLNSPLTQLDLVIEDPPDKADWLDLSIMINDRYGDTLQSLRISATGSSRFTDLVRSASRAEPPTHHLPLDFFTLMPALAVLDIDLPESVIFFNSDIAHVADACPNIEVLKLCPQARFPTTAPKITLEGLEPLMRCKRLHTLGLVVNGKRGSQEVSTSQKLSSNSLLRLSLGHSWISDPLQVTILLSHFAPHLETLKWFKEKNRSGFVEANAQGWQMVSDFLPHIQKVRLVEREAAKLNVYVRPQTAEKSIDATVSTSSRGVTAKPRTGERSIQAIPQTVTRMIEAKPNMFSISIDATPTVVNAGIDAVPKVSYRSVDATVSTESKSIGTFEPSTVIKRNTSFVGSIPKYALYPHHYIFPAVVGVLSTAFIIVTYPLRVPRKIFNISVATFHEARKEYAHDMEIMNIENDNDLPTDTDVSLADTSSTTSASEISTVCI
jgi:hypothetical protein